MQFTHPDALWLLPLLAIPPLLVRRRRPAGRVAVSSLYLWRAARDLGSGGLALRRVRRTRTMLVQMLCMTAMIAALAGPVITLAGGQAVFVFDVSASMAAREGGSTRLDDARARARTIVDALPPASRVRLVSAGAPPRELGDFAAADPRLISTIDALAPTAGPADLSSAVEAATQLGGADRVIVFSDLPSATTAGGASNRPAVQWVRVGRAANNAAVTHVAARVASLGGRAGQVLVAVRNFGAETRNADVEVAVDGRVTHRAPVRLPPSATATLNVDLPDLGRVVTARLVGDDALPIDDTRSAVVPRASRIRVALAGPRGSFIEQALSVNSSVSLETYDSGTDLSGAVARNDFDVLVCDGCDDRVAAAKPVLIVTAIAEGPTRGLLAIANPTHPLATTLELGQQIATVAGASTSPPDDDVIVRAGGIPAVTAADREGRRIVDVRIDLAKDEFVLNPAFPVLVASSLEWLADDQLAREVPAGSPLVFARAESEAESDRVVGPDGRPRDVRRGNRQLIVTDTDAPGVYRFLANGAEDLRIVNPVVDGESDLSAGQDLGAQSQTIAPQPVGTPVAAAPWLLVLAFGLLVLEWQLRTGGGS